MCIGKKMCILLILFIYVSKVKSFKSIFEWNLLPWHYKIRVETDSDV